uniref:Secreted protein n=1 Tax=Lotharella oceanica TaxID=641309 RepID=A0A7S2TKG9_9EUKA|mmetsp:Transcript_18471/g.34865  ORF Transcript_18471/g.34865 Transcript_18471/m.34865 type:complete len:146 (+) Transcript_18471:364-801(+)
MAPELWLFITAFLGQKLAALLFKRTIVEGTSAALFVFRTSITLERMAFVLDFQAFLDRSTLAELVVGRDVAIKPSHLQLTGACKSIPRRLSVELFTISRSATDPSHQVHVIIRSCFASNSKDFVGKNAEITHTKILHSAVCLKYR